MIRMVAAAFGLPDVGLSKAALLKEIERFLIAHVKAGKRVLLVVDEAQNLPPRSLEELRMLSNFQLGEKALLPSFLLGQKEFRTTLLAEGLEQLRQRVIAACHLSPLPMEETKNYIEHRLRLVGWQDRPSFTEDAYQAIYQATRGTPRRINLLCDRLLLYGFLEEQAEITQDTVRTVQQELMGELSPMPQAEGQVASVASSEQMLVETDGLKLDTRPSDTVESRLHVLERHVELLETAMRREFGLLRRAILFNQR